MMIYLEVLAVAEVLGGTKGPIFLVYIYIFVLFYFFTDQTNLGWHFLKQIEEKMF